MSRALQLEIELCEPLLATGVANSEENSSISLDYLPGSALRGACVGLYLRNRGPDYDLAGDAVARSLFFSDEVCFLNGYIAHPTDATRRALPVPLSWHAQKDDLDSSRHKIWDFAVESPSDAETALSHPKGEPRPYFWQPPDDSDRPMALKKPEVYASVHNASNKVGLKQAAESTVFRYEALAAGQRLVAYILGYERQLQSIHDLLTQDNRLHLGGSRTAGYGWVSLKVVQLDNWAGEAIADARLEGELTTITLLSDAILRDRDGQPTTDFHAALSAALDRADLLRGSSYARVHLVGGFNRKWGLPLPQQWAVSRGSTFTYCASDLPPTSLARLLASGIGARRNEGFGRLGLNLNGQASFQSETPRRADVFTLPDLSVESQELARRMQERRAQRLVEQALPTFLARVKIEGAPRNSQLARLRQLVRQALVEEDLGELVTLLDETEQREVTREQWQQRLTVEGQSASWVDWIRERLRQQDGLALLGVEDAAYQFLLPDAKGQLKFTVTSQVVAAVLYKAIKLNRERE